MSKHEISADTAAQVMRELPLPTTKPGELPTGFRAGATLPLRVELARQLRRRRTQLIVILLMALPAILSAAFAMDRGRSGRGTSFIDLARSSGFNFTVVTVFFSATFLLVVVVALCFGDTVASEAQWSSLRYLLAIPVPRHRLLRQKLLAALVLAGLALLVLVGSALCVGGLLYGFSALSTPVGETFTGLVAVGRILLLVCYVAISLSWVAGLAFLLSVSTDAPLGAVGGAVLVAILSQILDQITALGGLRNWLPTHYSFAWTGVMVDPIQFGEMARGAALSLGYAVVLMALAFWRFAVKDVTS